MTTNIVYWVHSKTDECRSCLVVDDLFVKDFGYKNAFDVASILREFTGEKYETRTCSRTVFDRNFKVK